MMSPFGNQNGLTPSTQLANLQLAALPNIPVSKYSSVLNRFLKHLRSNGNRTKSVGQNNALDITKLLRNTLFFFGDFPPKMMFFFAQVTMRM